VRSRPRIFSASQKAWDSATCGGGRKAPEAATVVRQDAAPANFVVHRNHGIGRILEARKSGDQRRIPRNYLVVQLRRRHPAGGGGPARQFLAATGPGSDGPTRSQPHGRGGLEPGKNGPQDRAQVALDLVPKALYAEPPPGPRVRSRRLPLQAELEDPFPYEPTPDQYKAISEV